MAPDEPDLPDTTTDDSVVVKYYRGGMATIDPTDVSTATPDNYYNSSEPIDWDNRHERRKKKALARRKRNVRK